MEKQVIFLDKKDNLTEVIFSGAPSWDNFESLALFLEQFYNANIYAKYDGPDARAWKIIIGNVDTTLFHDDLYGNYMEARTPEEADLIKTIGLDIKKTFRVGRNSGRSRSSAKKSRDTHNKFRGRTRIDLNTDNNDMDDRNFVGKAYRTGMFLNRLAKSNK